jgi:hypothetical protein
LPNPLSHEETKGDNNRLKQEVEAIQDLAPSFKVGGEGKFVLQASLNPVSLNQYSNGYMAASVTINSGA